MFDDMKQFLISDICLSCEGCCRFDKQKSDWRAKAGKVEENLILEDLGRTKKIISADIMDKGGYLKDNLCHGIYSCMFFNHEDTTCQIYQNRPFECRLYPFVLTAINDRPCVSIHLTCPYVEQTKDSKQYQEYVLYLKEYFKTKKITQLLNNNPHLFGKYRGYEEELEWLFDVELSNEFSL